MNSLVDIPISTLSAGGLFPRRMDSSCSASLSGLPENPSITSLLSDVSVCKQKGIGDGLVTCLITDSRRVVPGALFFAIEVCELTVIFTLRKRLIVVQWEVVSSQDLGSHFPIDYFLSGRCPCGAR